MLLWKAGATDSKSGNDLEGKMGERVGLERELADLGLRKTNQKKAREHEVYLDNNHPVLAGPIVRRATTDKVWFWLACNKEIKDCAPSLVAYPHGYTSQYSIDPLLRDIGIAKDFKTVRLGKSIWIVLVSVVPKTGKFPTDIVIGYDLSIRTEESGEIKTVKLSELNLRIAYPPFPLPTFVIGNLNRQLVHGSCRRPGAKAEDAFFYYDQWLASTASDGLNRPASLILTGDQIYADDVAIPLFEAVHQLAVDVFGYVERIPKEAGGGLSLADDYSWEVKPGDIGKGRNLAWSGRKRLTHRTTSPIGFTTEDGEAHLLSFPEFSAMYLIVWSPDLCRAYLPRVEGVNKDSPLHNYCSYVEACRRVMANSATYMLCDDHEITDDWNLDQQWEDKTKKNSLARRIIANGLAAYWAFQAWGNDPDTFDNKFLQVLTLYFEQLQSSGGYPRNIGSRSPYDAVGKYEELLLNAHWSFMAASNPKALCVDTRTRRKTPQGKSAILSGEQVQPYLKDLLQKHGFRKGDPLLLVLPTPFLPHRSMMYIQKKEYNFPRQRYQGDYELYGNNPEQRAELVFWLHEKFDPSALVIFSGDVHHGSVVTGRYAYGAKLEEIKAGRADWVMRIVQITSSPIKNEKNVAYRKKRWWTAWQTDAGNVGESLITQWEHQYRRIPDGKYLAMQAAVRSLKGKLGRETYIFEPHVCVVNMPDQPKGLVRVTFIGEKGRSTQTAEITVDTDNDSSKFVFTKTQYGGTEIVTPPQD